jgi:hypothetical protein
MIIEAWEGDGGPRAPLISGRKRRITSDSCLVVRGEVLRREGGSTEGGNSKSQELLHHPPLLGALSPWVPVEGGNLVKRMVDFTRVRAVMGQKDQCPKDKSLH